MAFAPDRAGFMRNSLHPRPARRQELPQAFRLIFQHVPPEDRESPKYDGYSVVAEASEVGRSLEPIRGGVVADS